MNSAPVSAGRKAYQEIVSGKLSIPLGEKNERFLSYILENKSGGLKTFTTIKVIGRKYRKIHL